MPNANFYKHWHLIAKWEASHKLERVRTYKRSVQAVTYWIQLLLLPSRWRRARVTELHSIIAVVSVRSPAGHRGRPAAFTHYNSVQARNQIVRQSQNQIVNNSTTLHSAMKFFSNETTN